ncbi:MAG: ribonuclease III [Actinobacteria bacterium]|nr:ribonuclease III [Actinomycetota bacterium]
MNTEQIINWAKDQKLVFKKKEILIKALTHRSYLHDIDENTETNERLEFLGDSVLSLIIISYLYQKFPTKNEGELAKIKSNLVSGDTLSQLAKDIDLGKVIILGENEDGSGGRKKDSILADALEALIGAIYLDLGIKKTKKWVINLYSKKIDDEVKKPFLDDYKTRLQEILSQKKVGKLSYKILKEEGPDHAKMFLAKTFLDKIVIGEGWGSSKKDAEQEAAKLALMKISKNI